MSGHHCLTLRPATLGDVTALVELERRVFDSDRLNRRSFRRLIGRRTADCLVAVKDDRIAGYVLLLYRSDTALARLYSIAVDPDLRGARVGAALLEAAENAAFDRDCIFLRLEVRPDNPAAIALYTRRGYRQFGRYEDYYADHAAALRFEKRLTPGETSSRDHPPYYPQSTDFTCGPACMLMTLAWFDRSFKVDRRGELKLWREATTIFMTSGVGGCEPFGMAVALAKRGLKPAIWSTNSRHFYLDEVKSRARKDVMRVVQDDFRAQAKALAIPLERRALGREPLSEALGSGAVAIVLVSGYHMFRDHTPHWVLAHDCDLQHVYVHDPWIEDEALETATAVTGLPIPWRHFDRMCAVGVDRRSAAIVVNGERR